MKKYRVRLSEAERLYLHELLSAGTHASRKLTRARILPKTDEGEAGPAWTDNQISVALEVGLRCIEQVRQRYAAGGLGAALERRPTTREYQRRLDGEQEARLIALACGDAPDGQDRWSLRLLADRMVELGYVEQVSYETVRQVLQKTTSSPG